MFCRKNGYSLGYINKVNSVQDLQDSAQPAFHLSGTTRMNKTLVNSVVDSNGSLLNISNCFVLGSSIFPTCGWANPTLSIMALSIRTVDKVHLNVPH
jgi:choline dehydrogenase-like flavoprotein